MKIAYVFSSPYWKYDGITKKIIEQISEWIEAGYECRGFCLAPASAPQPEIEFLEAVYTRKIGIRRFDGSRVLIKYLLQRQFSQAIADFHPDIVYMRYEPFKPYLRGVKSLGIPIILELNSIDTVEGSILSRKNLIGTLFRIYNLLFRKFTFKMSQGVVAVCDEIRRHPEIRKFGLKSAVVPNSTALGKRKILKRKHSTKIPRVLFMVSKNFPWQGLDKLKELARMTEGRLNFTVVGHVDKEYFQEPNVLVTGFLSNRKLIEAASSCDIALTGLALHRIGINEASTLKVRDYLAWGFPIILTHVDEAFRNSDLEWILKISNSEDNVKKHAKDIEAFCYRLKDRIVQHEESRCYIDHKVNEKKRTMFFEEIISV